MAAATNPFVRLVYVSRASPHCEADLDRALSDILTDAIPHNRERDITGLLIAHRGWFIQALEGPEQAVRETFIAVQQDHRHQTPQVLIDAQTDRRMFPGCSMGARALNEADTAVLRGYDKPGKFDPAALPEKTLLRLLAIVSEAHQDRFAAQQRMMPRR